MARTALLALALALLLAACGIDQGREQGVAFSTSVAPTPRNCPFEARSGPDPSEEGRVFGGVFGFVGADWARQSVVQLDRMPGRERRERAHLADQLRDTERDARSHLTPAYDSRLARLEDAGTPFHTGAGARSFYADYLETHIERGAATQEIYYCFIDGEVWTQVFHLRRIDGVWKVDSIEPARRRNA